ncbi:hypothetical protein O4J56_14140 [Nocardiopsis sp. RSe5-2]|uniref:DUF317 domain-containing protein n=1 Tax=Nocardiopsis endophytica TaxID=3018445 RepID=A0ABT4U4A0_9ACTN|nr:hypothetical protein [Nocardiopsis endophytica]MDA2811778.1 hypothetical protein [Nocardiopsis endophytica]
MPGYMITTADGSDWPVVHRRDFEAVLQPRSRECTVVEPGENEHEDGDGAEGDHVFRTGGAVVSASWELAGVWSVHIEGAAEPGTAESIVSEMARQLGEATGQAARHHRIVD